MNPSRTHELIIDPLWIHSFYFCASQSRRGDLFHPSGVGQNNFAVIRRWAEQHFPVYNTLGNSKVSTFQQVSLFIYYRYFVLTINIVGLLVV